MKHLIAFAVATFAFAGLAKASDPDLAVKELTRCDGSFFAALNAQRMSLEALGTMSTVGTSSKFAVPDRRHPTKSKMLFAKPVTVQGLKVIGFFDEVADIPGGMTSYSWGYLVASTVSTTATAMKPLVWESERLHSDGPVFVRSEVWSHDAPSLGWAKVRTEAGVPKKRTVERVFLVEPYDGEDAFVRAGCSIQGNVTLPLLQEVRPDLRP